MNNEWEKNFPAHCVASIKVRAQGLTNSGWRYSDALDQAIKEELS